MTTRKKVDPKNVVVELPNDGTRLQTLAEFRESRPHDVDPAAFRTVDPTGYIVWAKKEFVRALGNVGSVLSACVAVGAERAEVVAWRNEDKDFADAWDGALLDATERLENAAVSRAVHGVLEPVFYGARVVGHKRVYSDSLLSKLLEGAMPTKYRKNVTVEGGNTPVGVRVTDTRRESIAEKLANALGAAEAELNDEQH